MTVAPIPVMPVDAGVRTLKLEISPVLFRQVVPVSAVFAVIPVVLAVVPIVVPDLDGGGMSVVLILGIGQTYYWCE